MDNKYTNFEFNKLNDGFMSSIKIQKDYFSSQSLEEGKLSTQFSKAMTQGNNNSIISGVPKSRLYQYLNILGSYSSYYKKEIQNYNEEERLKHLQTEIMRLNLFEDISRYLSKEEDIHNHIISSIGLSRHNQLFFENSLECNTLTQLLKFRMGNPKTKNLKSPNELLSTNENISRFLEMRKCKESNIVNNKNRFIVVSNDFTDMQIDEEDRKNVDKIILEKLSNNSRNNENKDQIPDILGDQNYDSYNQLSNFKNQYSYSITETQEDKSKKRKRRAFKVPRMVTTSQEDENQEDYESTVTDFISASEYKPSKKRKDDIDPYSGYKAPAWDPASSLRNTSNSNNTNNENQNRKRSKFINPLEKKEQEEKKKENEEKKQKQKEKKKHRPGSDLGLFDENGDLNPELEGLEEALVERIALEVIESTSTITWEDIGGLEYAKQAVEEAVLWPLQQPEFFSSELLKGSRGLMLFGPPGTGKTLIAKAIASQGAARFFSISASSLMSKWLGEGEQLVKTLFKVASFLKPSIVFLDEIDAILSKRGSSDDSGGARRLKTEFLVQLDGAGSDSDGIVIICATNLPWEIDDAVLRRIRQKIYVPLPDKNARLQILKSHARKGGVIQFGLDEQDFDTVAEITDGYSGSDLKKLSQQSMMIVIRELKRNSTNTNQRKITIADYQAALKEIRPSVDRGLLSQFVDWDSKFGSNSE